MDTPTTRWVQGDAKALVRALGERAEAVCRHYLPRGRRCGRYWLVGNVRGDRGDSMYVRLGPPGTVGWWSDAATGERGDLLELLRRQRGDARMAGAMAEARQFLGGVPVPAPAKVPPQRRPGAHGRSEAPRRLWALCRPIDGTAAEAYLRARGIRACQYAALAFHPAIYYRDADDGDQFRSLPALVARVTAHDGAFLGVQRIYLDPARPAKAQVPQPKKCMGRVHGGAVVLGEADATTLVVAEGIETALSVLSARPGLRAAAALSAGGLAALTPPPGTARVLIARDGDTAGATAAERLAARCRAQGVAVTVLTPRRGDFNDELLANGPDILGARIDAALADSGRTSG